jgi:phytoene synthase
MIEASRARPPDGVLAECRAILGRGSKSFAAASRLLPARLRDPVAAYYAFCRVSDDAVDASAEPARALEALHARLDAIVEGRPEDHPADVALAWVVRAYGIPRAPLDALLEGYLWDVEGRRYEDLAGVRAYSARVAASVGVVMTLLMGPREPHVLYRAADLGVAMQLTNIARDVGEDARAGRVYLPLAWLRAEGVDPDAFVRDPRPSVGVRVASCRLLDHAEWLYRRAEAGIPALPADCRTAITAARAIYADIGRVVREHDHDSVSSRAVTTGARKAWLLARSRLVPVVPSTDLYAPPLDEIRFLVSSLDHPPRTGSPGRGPIDP